MKPRSPWARRYPSRVHDGALPRSHWARQSPGSSAHSWIAADARGKQMSSASAQPGRTERDAAVGGVEGGVTKPDQLNAEKPVASLWRADVVRRAPRRTRCAYRRCPRPAPSLQPTKSARNAWRRRTPQLAQRPRPNVAWWPACRCEGDRASTASVAATRRTEREVDAHLSVVRERYMLSLGIDSQVLIAPVHLATGQQDGHWSRTPRTRPDRLERQRSIGVAAPPSTSRG